MKSFEDLVNGQHNGTKRGQISSTLLMTSSGFELFDQALCQPAF